MLVTVYPAGNDGAPAILRSSPVVLVVDDDADTRVIYRLYLRAMGCRVVTARDGASGIAKAMDVHPDVIVMDLAMPGVDGWTAARRLKRRHAI